MKMSQNVITTSTRNWLGSWGRIRLGLLAGVVAGVIACEEPQEIGLPPTTPVDITYSDTLSVIRQTIRFDSVQSNDRISLMVGRYTDPVFGRIQARAYVQGRLASDFVVNDTATTNATPANRIVLDSTRLVLDLNGLWYGDTTKPQEVQIFRLADSLRTATTYDISSTVSAESQPLARQLIRPRPTARDSVNARFALPESYGRQILALANTDAGKVANLSAFRSKFLSDLLIAPGTVEQSSVLGYSPGSVTSDGFVFGSYVAVYYHVEGEKGRRQQFVLLNGKRFNQITADRSGTPLANLQRGQPVPPTAANGQTFVQPATGITTKLSFPGLDQIRKAGRVAINRADLIITPKAVTNALHPVPRYLALSEVSTQNKILRTTTNRIIQFVPLPQTLFDRTELSFNSPQIATYDSRTNSYSFEMGGYFQSILAGATPNNGLVLLNSEQPQTGTLTGILLNSYVNVSVRQAILEGNASAKLIVFYTTSN